MIKKLTKPVLAGIAAGVLIASYLIFAPSSDERQFSQYKSEVMDVIYLDLYLKFTQGSCQETKAGRWWNDPKNLIVSLAELNARSNPAYFQSKLVYAKEHNIKLLRINADAQLRDIGNTSGMLSAIAEKALNDVRTEITSKYPSCEGEARRIYKGKVDEFNKKTEQLYNNSYINNLLPK